MNKLVAIVSVIVALTGCAGSPDEGYAPSRRHHDLTTIVSWASEASAEREVTLTPPRVRVASTPAWLTRAMLEVTPPASNCSSHSCHDWFGQYLASIRTVDGELAVCVADTCGIDAVAFPYGF